jgi:hypothetical protein
MWHDRQTPEPNFGFDSGPCVFVGMLLTAFWLSSFSVSRCVVGSSIPATTRFVGPRKLPRQLMGCSGLCPLDAINPNISTGRAQGHLLSSWLLVEEWSLAHKRTDKPCE